MSEQDNVKKLNKLPSIESGAVIQVSDSSGGLKYVSRFVGIDGAVVITRLPAVSQINPSAANAEDLTFRDTFHKKRTLVMRLISKGQVYAFETEVIDLFLQGSKLLMSSYPKLVQSRMLRKEPRYPCALPATLKIGELTTTGVLVNFSLGGGLFQLTEEVDATVLRQAKADDQALELQLQLPFDEQPEKLSGKLMSAPSPEGQVGVAFDSGTETIQRYITSLKLDTISGYF